MIKDIQLKNDYFIIESLQKDDIKDGIIFYNSLLSLNKFNPKYIEVKTKKEFEEALLWFSKSNYKNLFISSHGDEENIHLLNDSFNAYDLQDLKLDLKQKRIFMSTCKGGSFLLAKYFIQKNAYSVVGSPDNLPQITTVGMWTTMIIIFERVNNRKVEFREIDTSLTLLSKIYEIKLVYYSFIRSSKKMKEYLYIHNKKRTRNDYEI